MSKRKRAADEQNRLVAIVLAAGLSTRMGADNKLLIDIEGEPMISRVVRTCAGAQLLSRIVVVTGHDERRVSAALTGFPVDVVYNPNYNLGMGSSLMAGVTAAEAANGYLIWPGDMPWIASDTVTRVCRAYNSTSIVVPTFSGRRGHPILFSSAFREQLLHIGPGAGAHAVVEGHRESVIECEVDDPNILVDIDDRSDMMSTPMNRGGDTS